MKIIIKILFILFIFAGCSSEDEIIEVQDPKMISFSIKEIQSEFEIDATNMTIEATLLEDVNLTNLTAVFQASEKSTVFVGITKQVSGVTKNDFSKPIKYIVENIEGKKISYDVIINPTPKIKSFKIAELENVNFEITSTNISAKVPSGTKLNNLTAVFQLTTGASLLVNGVTQVSNQTKNDFSSSLTYLLIAPDQSIKQYTVSITENPNNLPQANAGDDKIYFISSNQSTTQVTLDGSKSSDVEADLISFEWKLNGTIIGDSKISNINLGLGTYTIELTVTDSSNDTDKDMVVIEVRQLGTYIPIDLNASFETKNLFQTLAEVANSNQFIFGQEFPMSFQLNNLRNNLSTSDCKDVTGDHPGVFGIDPHYMLYKGEQQKQLHIQEAKYAYQNGGIVTFDFHQQSKDDHKIYFEDITTATDKSLMYDIVNNLNGSRVWFYKELDQVLDIINNDLGFPIVFRLFHEMDGDWFWWGSKATNHSPSLYIDFYRLAVDYIKERTKLVLFSWSPNQQISSEYYPGDFYVDVIGIDVYNPTSKNVLKQRLIDLTSFATTRGKVAALTETGAHNYITNNPTFWTSTVLAAIEEGGSNIKLGWVLAWFNAPWKSTQNDLFIPNSNSSSAIKEDFIKFYNSPITLFLQETAALKVYD